MERWIEDSGNAALMGCELPPDEVLAADQRITAWAHELKKAGLDGGMDQLRARAYLDLLLGKDSRPRPADPQPGAPGQDSPGSPGGPLGSAVPAGFAGRVTLTAPLVTLARLADRPGELAGLGPVDPWLARDLAAAAAANPKTTWCVTVTDAEGMPSATAAPGPRPGSPETRRARPARRDGVHLHPGQPGRPARRLRHLDATHPRTRPRPDRDG